MRPNFHLILTGASAPFFFGFTLDIFQTYKETGISELDMNFLKKH